MQVLEDVLHVDAACNKVRAILFHRAQQFFPALINGRHIGEINDARPAVRFAVATFPCRAKLADPGARQLAA